MEGQMKSKRKTKTTKTTKSRTVKKSVSKPANRAVGLRKKMSNYCMNCGYLTDSFMLKENCPICSADRKSFAMYDANLDHWVKESVDSNLKFPDIHGTNWADSNSSLSRHVRAAVYNALMNYKSRK